VLSSIRGHDSKLFTRAQPFHNHPMPTIVVSSPKCGLSPSTLSIDHTPLGTNRFPELQWSMPSTENTSTTTNPAKLGSSQTADIVEWLVVVEDPDAPLPSPVIHGIYYAIPGNKTSLSASDFEPVDGLKSSTSTQAKTEHSALPPLRGGFHYGANRMGSVWGGPRPVLGHGVHRYFFQVVGLSEKIDWSDGEGTSGSGPVSLKVVKEKVQGKVVAWGVWIGTFERSIERAKEESQVSGSA